MIASPAGRGLEASARIGSSILLAHSSQEQQGGAEKNVDTAVWNPLGGGEAILHRCDRSLQELPVGDRSAELRRDGPNEHAEGSLSLRRAIGEVPRQRGISPEVEP
jgi:hypothetical protein